MCTMNDPTDAFHTGSSILFSCGNCPNAADLIDTSAQWTATSSPGKYHFIVPRKKRLKSPNSELFRPGGAQDYLDQELCGSF